MGCECCQYLDWWWRGWWGTLNTPRENRKARSVASSTQQKVKESILLQRQSWSANHRSSETVMQGHSYPLYNKEKQKTHFGDFPSGPVVKTLPSRAGNAGSILGQGTKIPHASWPKNQNIKQKQCCNKVNKDFKNGPHFLKKLKKKKDTLSFLSPPSATGKPY